MCNRLTKLSVTMWYTFFGIFDDTSLWILPKTHDPSLWNTPDKLVSNLYHMVITCTLHWYLMYHMGSTCTSHGYYMHTTSVSHVYHCTTWVLHVHHMGITCISHGYHMLLHGYHMHTTSVSHVYLYTTWLLRVHHMDITWSIPLPVGR